MDAKKQLDALLESSGAVLIRRGKHLIYELPSGNKFTVPKTPSDSHSYKNSFSDLKKALGIKKPSAPLPYVHPEGMATAAGPETTPEVEPVKHQDIEEPMATAAIATVMTKPAIYIPAPPPPIAAPQAVTAPAPTPAPEPPPKPLRERIEERIAAEKQRYEELMALAQLAEGRAKMFEGLLGHTEDAGMEFVLLSLFPTPKPVATPPSPAPPLEPATERIIVTRELVREACLSFNGIYNTAQVLDALIGDRDIDVGERRRASASLAPAMTWLESNGLIMKLATGRKGAPATWRNVSARQ